MKVQKIVSLTPATAEIAQDMRNFSKFVRNSLMAYDIDESPGYWHAQMMHWKRVAHNISEQLANAINENDFRFSAEVTSYEIIAEARESVDSQKTLEDY